MKMSREECMEVLAKHSHIDPVYTPTGDDSFEDQVVYHEDHLENLLGLYNRSDEVKPRFGLQRDILKIEGEAFKDHLALDVPSDRETAVWGALQSSELCFEEALGGTRNAVDQVNHFDSWDSSVKDHPLSRECLGSLSPHGLESKNIEADGSQQTEASYLEARADTLRREAQSRDDWDHVDANIDGIDEHVLCQPLIKFGSHKLKGTMRKKLNLSFRSMHNFSHPNQEDEHVNEDGKLSLAQRLQNLADSSSNKTKVQASPKPLGSCSSIPISLKLSNLVRNDATLDMNRKERALLSTGRATGESINDQFRKALLEAPPVSSEELNRQGRVHGAVSGFTARLQKVLERERNERSEFFRFLQTNHDLIEEQMSYIDVQIMSKSLEARLSACECNIVNCSKAYETDSSGNSTIMVIFGMQANSQMELECGTVVRLYPPWQEVMVQNANDIVKTILCTYFCEVLRSHESRQIQ